MNEGMLTTGDLARVLGITPAGVRYLLAQGKIEPDNRTEKGWPLFTRATASRILQAREHQEDAAAAAREVYLREAFELQHQRIREAEDRRHHPRDIGPGPFA